MKWENRAENRWPFEYKRIARRGAGKASSQRRLLHAAMLRERVSLGVGSGSKGEREDRRWPRMCLRAAAAAAEPATNWYRLGGLSSSSAK